MVGAFGLNPAGLSGHWNLFYLNVNPFNIYVNIFHMDHPAIATGERPWVKALSLGLAAAPALTVLGFIMAADLVLCLSGLVVDRRVIAGAPAWLKPAKFALSVMIACWSFAFCIASTRIWRMFTRALDVVLTVGFALEIALIDMQAEAVQR